jgi:transcription-repair coupling factor (superfamily II helicase)
LRPEIIDKYTQSPKVKQISAALELRENKLHVKGLLGSSLSFVIDPLFRQGELPFLLILKDKE